MSETIYTILMVYMICAIFSYHMYCGYHTYNSYHRCTTYDIGGDFFESMHYSSSGSLTGSPHWGRPFAMHFATTLAAVVEASSLQCLAVVAGASLLRRPAALRDDALSPSSQHVVFKRSIHRISAVTPTSCDDGYSPLLSASADSGLGGTPRTLSGRKVERGPRLRRPLYCFPLRLRKSNSLEPRFSFVDILKNQVS